MLFVSVKRSNYNRLREINLYKPPKKDFAHTEKMNLESSAYNKVWSLKFWIAIKGW